MNITIEQVINSSHSDVLVPPKDTSAVLTTLVWDSREACPNSLFIAVVGEKVNGNDYIMDALEAGAALVIASEPPLKEVLDAATQKGAALLLASQNGLIADLQEIARSWRLGLTGKVVGITGSTGKTTTKDLIAGVVSSRYKTHATRGNRNSEIGLAETLLDATKEDEVIVCEMGMQAMGEIDALCQAALPHIGVITNIGVAHCELVGSRDNIAKAKAELLENLPDNTGIAVLPGDDPYMPLLRTHARLDERMVSVVTYGLGAQNDLRATSIEYDEMGHPSFTVWMPDGSSYAAHLNLQGEHNVLNALAAIAVGIKLGVSREEIIAALAEVKPAALRQELVKTNDGILILNDTYNANPDSMRAALSLLKRLASGGKRIAVLGDMYELGSEENKYHQQIGEYAFVNSVDELVTVGALGSHIAAGALGVGMPEARVRSCSEVDEALAAVEDLISELRAHNKDDQIVILVKASRGMQLERIVQGLSNSAKSGA